MTRIISILIVLFISLDGLSQGQIAVSGISIHGNNKTKDKIILRELTFKVGDIISTDDFKEKIKRSQENILNTSLFIKAEIQTNLLNKGQVEINIVLVETWYLYPYPIFELADRNFNVWWQEQGRSLRRVNFGIRLNYINPTGNRDRLKLTLQDGYTKKYEIDYFIPGINKAQTIGLFTNAFFSRGKEIAYVTDENKLLFENFNDEFIIRRFRASAGLSYRPGFYNYHTFKFIYSDNSIGERIAFDLNPEYFLNNSNRQKHFTMQYEGSIDRRDIKPYPLNGYLLNARVQKDGFGIFNDVNAFFISGVYAQYFSFTPKISFEGEIRAKYSFIRKQQPYTHVSNVGYGANVMNGYELFVIDGLDFGMLKSTFRFSFLEKEFKWGKIMPIKSFKEMPTKWYFTVNNDIGYVNAPYYNHYGTLNNKLLWGGGFGLNLVFYFDKVLKIEYSWNQLGENGVFLDFSLTL